MGCDARADEAGVNYSGISIHAPAWGATRVTSTLQKNVHPFQSTHPHGVRLAAKATVTAFVVISIHAPAWGATRKALSQNRSVQFQSTHPHGVRLKPVWPFLQMDPNFNPRTRMGCDRFREADTRAMAISIHAPAWGATPDRSQRLARPAYFNPRTRMGCDDETFEGVQKRLEFQSTHPHGVRPAEGLHDSMRLLISIHAPAWGATFAVTFVIEAIHISIHAPAWGATTPKFGDDPDTEISIHAPAWGAT